MVRTQTMDKSLGNHIYKTLRNLYPNNCVEILVEEHGPSLRIRLNDVRKLPVDMQESIKLVNAIVKREPDRSFDGGNWCSFYYKY